MPDPRDLALLLGELGALLTFVVEDERISATLPLDEAVKDALDRSDRRRADLSTDLTAKKAEAESARSELTEARDRLAALRHFAERPRYKPLPPDVESSLREILDGSRLTS